MSAADLEEAIHRFLSSSLSVCGGDYQRFVEIFLRSIEGSGRGLLGTEEVLFNYLVDIIAALRRIDRDTLPEMRAFIGRHRTSYSYAYVVDCLGLPDIYALWFAAGKRKIAPLLKVFINARAVTEPFKKTFDARTMAEVAGLLRGIAIKRLDTLLHSDAFARPCSREELARTLVARMKYVESLVPLEGATIVLSDHGYDVMRKGSLYTIQHGHGGKPALAKLAPVLLLKRC